MRRERSRGGSQRRHHLLQHFLHVSHASRRPHSQGRLLHHPCCKSVAFVGPSGCGKSTIISLIQRFYRPDTGSISLGGDLIESLNMDWYRGLLGAVNQEPVMFAGTIRSNLQLGVERTLTDGELEEALCLDLATRCLIDSIPI